MAVKKIRIYELARELGISNEEVLELATELKIGVKSHSSSLEDPMADRVRRLADSKGMRREPIVEEPAKSAKKTAKKSTAKKTAKKATATETDSDADAPVAPEAPHRVVRSTGGIPEPEVFPADGDQRVVRSTGGVPETPGERPPMPTR
ncbi:MAG TPA: translation initiation factor IF-2 N-terminal domain-containing protein, partial [Acidimicrobiia bacterium]|nr:translation initiation factor IF-2 N-terminal domain-containing protein [Acidimicrobiia bacterium]